MIAMSNINVNKPDTHMPALLSCAQHALTATTRRNSSQQRS